ncbi:MAG: hypothetical protein KatS3mg129_2269 [Leptospiraceae bacterium]|nr:MAG: hypothetical protein KatS3mg129_2269 [Leptospiraceae bacterium]
MPTYYLKIWNQNFVHSIYKNNFPGLNNIKSHKIKYKRWLLQNTDPFLFSKDWYYCICNKRSSTAPNLKTEDIVIFGHYDIKNQQIEIYCLFIVKDDFLIKKNQYYNLPFLFV